MPMVLPSKIDLQNDAYASTFHTSPFSSDQEFRMFLFQ